MAKGKNQRKKQGKKMSVAAEHAKQQQRAEQREQLVYQCFAGFCLGMMHLGRDRKAASNLCLRLSTKIYDDNADWRAFCAQVDPLLARFKFLFPSTVKQGMTGLRRQALSGADSSDYVETAMKERERMLHGQSRWAGIVHCLAFKGADKFANTNLKFTIMDRKEVLRLAKDLFKELLLSSITVTTSPPSPSPSSTIAPTNSAPTSASGGHAPRLQTASAGATTTATSSTSTAATTVVAVVVDASTTDSKAGATTSTSAAAPDSDHEVPLPTTAAGAAATALTTTTTTTTTPPPTTATLILPTAVSPSARQQPAAGPATSTVGATAAAAAAAAAAAVPAISPVPALSPISSPSTSSIDESADTGWTPESASERLPDSEKDYTVAASCGESQAHNAAVTGDGRFFEKECKADENEWARFKRMVEEKWKESEETQKKNEEKWKESEETQKKNEEKWKESEETQKALKESQKKNEEKWKETQKKNEEKWKETQKKNEEKWKESEETQKALKETQKKNEEKWKETQKKNEEKWQEVRDDTLRSWKLPLVLSQVYNEFSLFALQSTSPGDKDKVVQELTTRTLWDWVDEDRKKRKQSVQDAVETSLPKAYYVSYAMFEKLRERRTSVAHPNIRKETEFLKTDGRRIDPGEEGIVDLALDLISLLPAKE